MSMPVSSCMYSSLWSQHVKETSSHPHQWIVRDDLGASQITAPHRADATEDNKFTIDQHKDVSRPLREKNTRKNGKYVHVPHRDKPPQVVAKRNARERRRVQAVNGAFLRLRKAVPFENHRGKRVSKVKTLQNAIDYIQQLQELLQRDGCYQPLHFIPSYNEDFFDSLGYEDHM